MGSGWVRRGGGHKRGPDNNVTIRLAPLTSRAVEESESKQWTVAEGVSGRGERRGEMGVEGGSVSQGLNAGCCREGAEACVCLGVFAYAAENHRGRKVATLQCWHVVCVLETHYCTNPLPY